MLRRLKHLLGAIFLFLLSLISAWAVGLWLFAARIPAPLPEDAPLERTDAIVVLTGGSNRVDEGLKLLREGYAARLLISGVHDKTPLGDLMRDPDLAPLKARITLGREARDTFGNAVEAALWAREHEASTLRLVTAAYHMPRAMLEFRRELPGIRLVAHPVAPADFKQEAWWRDDLSRHLVISEYHKTLASYVREGLVAFLESGS